MKRILLVLFLLSLPIKAEELKWEIGDYELFQTHFNEPNWLTLHSEFGEIHEIEMGVPFKNENEYDFPV